MNFDFIAKPFGVIMQYIYQSLAFENYGVAIILFTIVVRILLFPLNLKQQKSMLKTQQLQPELEALKINYGDDKDALMREQQKLYAKYNINPMAGCLPTLVQFPVLITLYTIIRNPLQYISGMSLSVINVLQDFVAGQLGEKATKITQIGINDFFLNNVSKLAETEAAVSASDFINMTFLKIFNLGLTPSINPSKLFGDEWSLYLPLLLIPILACATTYLQQFVSTPRKKKNKNEAPDAASNMTNGMLKFMPLITLFFAFTMPAGLGFYWIIGNFLSIGQTVLINKFFIRKTEGYE